MKRHILTDGRGVPISALITGANVHDKWMVAPVLDAVPLRTSRGPRRPKHLCLVPPLLLLGCGSGADASPPLQGVIVVLLMTGTAAMIVSVSTGIPNPIDAPNSNIHASAVSVLVPGSNCAKINITPMMPIIEASTTIRGPTFLTS